MKRKVSSSSATLKMYKLVLKPVAEMIMKKDFISIVGTILRSNMQNTYWSIFAKFWSRAHWK